MITLLLISLFACAPDDPCAATRDLRTSPQGLELTQVEHRFGWGNDQCFQCHQAWNIHQTSCMELVDINEIAEQLDVRDTLTCVSCHGTNGSDALYYDTGLVGEE